MRIRSLVRAALVGSSVALGMGAEQAHGRMPTDNPVASYYGQTEGWPAWTDRIRWDRAIDMSKYAKGRTAFERFENARDELAAKGGGVLYYPAGVYDFSDGPFDGPAGRGLMLRSGVVIRGERPLRDPDGRDGTLGLRTKFIFGGRKKRDNVQLVLKDAIRIHKRVAGRRQGEYTVRVVPHDVRLEFRLEGGWPHGDVFLTPVGLSDRVLRQATVKAVNSRWRIEVDLSLPPDHSQKKPRSARFLVEVKPEGDSFEGTYRATCEGLGEPKAEGKVTGGLAEPSLVPRDWNLIGLAPPRGESKRGVSAVHDVGIAWVHLVRAVVYFGPEMKWAPTWGECVRRRRDANVWSAHSEDRTRTTNAPFLKPAWRGRVPDGTHPWDPFTGSVTGDENYVGAGRGRLVFGCVLEDSAVLNDSHDLGAGPDMFFMMKFGARVAAYGSRVLVANNVLPKSRNNFRYSQHTIPAGGRSGKIIWGERRNEPRTLLWDYGKTCGIEINKDLVGNRHRPGLWEAGVVVRDNYVYNHGQKGINVSGTWVTIRNNVNQRDYLREGDDVYGLGGEWELTIDGVIESAPGGAGPISDNYSRPFDLAGANLWVDGNWFTNSGSDPGNDGEAILCQRYRGTHWQSWAATRNIHVLGEGERGYIGGWAVPTYGSLIAWNRTPGQVGSLATRGHSVRDAAFVHENPARITPREGEKNRRGETYDVITKSDRKPPAAPRNVRAAVHEGDAVRITWKDASDNEIGFRIDRRIDGRAWTTIAYRPRRSRGHPENPQEWIDFAAPPGRRLMYRVVAINESDDDTGAATPVGPVVIPPPGQGLRRRR